MEIDDIASYTLEKEDEIFYIYQRGYYGCTKIGWPIYIDRIGKVDPKKLLATTSHEQLFKHIWREWEKNLKLRFYASSILFDRQISQVFIIFDLKDL